VSDNILMKRKRFSFYFLYIVSKSATMSSELVRFGIAIDAELLKTFDAHIDHKGYANRSEAIRDLIRSDLIGAHIAHQGEVAATLTLVYDHHVRELSEKLTQIQHDLGSQVISTLHVHLDHDHCLEVIVMRGAAQAIQLAANHIIATKGVMHGQLSMTTVAQNKPHHDHSHVHDHHHTAHDVAK
jgi:CopG family transcriptional regulator, nickel-responsive regulator